IIRSILFVMRMALGSATGREPDFTAQATDCRVALVSLRVLLYYAHDLIPQLVVPVSGFIDLSTQLVKSGNGTFVNGHTLSST
ncbi:hypothetical protein, partial [Enterococcus faecalis]